MGCYVGPNITAPSKFCHRLVPDRTPGPGRRSGSRRWHTKIAKLVQNRVRQAWTVAQAPLRCFRRSHPPRMVIPSPIRIDDHYDRVTAMRSVFERLCPGSSERMETVMDRNRHVHTMGFVCGSTRLRSTPTSATTPCGSPPKRRFASSQRRWDSRSHLRAHDASLRTVIAEPSFHALVH